MAVKGYLRALLIALAFWLLMQAFMVAAGFVQLRSVSVRAGEAIRAAIQSPLNYALVPTASALVLFIVAFPHRGRDEGLLESVHVKPLLGGLVGLCFLAGAFLQLPFAEVGNLVQEVAPISFEELARRHRLVNPTTWSGGVSALIAVVLVASVTEELIFRGWILKDLEAEYGRRPALLWSSLLFGLVHIEASAVIYATLAGLVLGVVALRAKSTLASIAMHSGVNATPLLIPASVVRIEGFNTLDEQVVHISPWLVMTSLACAGFLLWLFWRATEPRVGDE